ncbi:MAG: class I SAM-dependent methyltransferase [Clostridiales bacterium]|nr:class I SAM-dependent methyltransferase [Clostridiales bacterium]
MGGYGEFSNYYDRLTFNVDYGKMADHICGLLSGWGITGGDLIDLACGTGSLSLEFAKRGFDIIGVDAGEGMLCCARQKFYDEGLTPPLLICQRLEELDLYGTANCAVCSLDSVNHLCEPEQVRAFFKRLSYFVEPGGVFVFDVNTLYKHRNILGDNIFIYDMDDLYCVWQNSLRDDGVTVDIDLDFFVGDGDTYRRSSESFCERAYSIEELTQWLENAGFEVCGVYDDLSPDPVRDDTERAVITARRK